MQDHKIWERRKQIVQCERCGRESYGAHSLKGWARDTIDRRKLVQRKIRTEVMSKRNCCRGDVRICETGKNGKLGRRQNKTTTEDLLGPARKPQWSKEGYAKSCKEAGRTSPNRFLLSWWWESAERFLYEVRKRYPIWTLSAKTCARIGWDIKSLVLEVILAVVVDSAFLLHVCLLVAVISCKGTFRINVTELVELMET